MTLQNRIRRFLQEHAGEGWEGSSLMVALSGGLDSLVLLHVLRFSSLCKHVHLQAAHFDHGMRRASAGDALWVKGLCRAWEVPLHAGQTERRLSSEEEARIARYEFLVRTKAREGADWLLTAHHGDDQSETVLFRILRGTGLAGLRGIPPRRSPGVLRPFLDSSRSELEAYAREAGIRSRDDPSNLDLRIPRNFLRHVVLPQVEERVAHGASRSLQRLSRLARENEAAWDSIIPELMQDMLEVDSRGIALRRSGFLAHHAAVRGRLLRAFLRQRGLVLDETGTRRVLEFTKTGASGRTLELPHGLRFHREFDLFRLEEERNPSDDVPILIPGPEAGSGQGVLGDRGLRARWGTGDVESGRYGVDLPLRDLDFPLRVRGWHPGDRISLSYGTKKLKKLLAEAGVPVGVRSRIPVLADQKGRILWVAGITSAASMSGTIGRGRFHIGIDDEDEC